jgi:propanol-preferring alcohol dehydrogenase
MAAGMPIKTHVEALPLAEANAALDRLRSGDVSGALVLVP